jgi:hypothetical protein
MDDWWIGDRLPVERRWWASLSFRLVLAILGLSLACGLALAASGQPKDCSQSVGPSATPVLFPASGKTGNPVATSHLEICNASAANTLGVNWVGGTASIGAAGTLTLSPGGCISWGASSPIVPRAVSIIGSGDPTLTACGYD